MRKGGLSALFCALLYALMVFWLIGDGVRSLYLESCLSSMDGEHTTATIDNMWYERGRFSHDYMTFHFVANGQTMHSRVETSGGVWGHQYIRHTVPVVYLKDNPQVAELDLPGEESFRKNQAKLSIGLGAFAMGIVCFVLLRRLYHFLAQRGEGSDLDI